MSALFHVGAAQEAKATEAAMPVVSVPVAAPQASFLSASSLATVPAWQVTGAGGAGNVLSGLSWNASGTPFAVTNVHNAFFCGKGSQALPGAMR